MNIPLCGKQISLFLHHHWWDLHSDSANLTKTTQENCDVQRRSGVAHCFSCTQDQISLSFLSQAETLVSFGGRLKPLSFDTSHTHAMSEKETLWTREKLPCQGQELRQFVNLLHQDHTFCFVRREVVVLLELCSHCFSFLLQKFLLGFFLFLDDGRLKAQEDGCRRIKAYSRPELSGGTAVHFCDSFAQFRKPKPIRALCGWALTTVVPTKIIRSQTWCTRFSLCRKIYNSDSTRIIQKSIYFSSGLLFFLFPLLSLCFFSLFSNLMQKDRHENICFFFLSTSQLDLEKKTSQMRQLFQDPKDQWTYPFFLFRSLSGSILLCFFLCKFPRFLLFFKFGNSGITGIGTI